MSNLKLIKACALFITYTAASYGNNSLAATVTISSNTDQFKVLMDQIDTGTVTQTLTWQDYENRLLTAIATSTNSAAGELKYGPILLNEWLTDGRLKVITTNWSFYITPKTIRSIDSTGSSITKLESYYKNTGDYFQYDGNMSFSGYPFISSTVAGSTITSFSVSATSGIPTYLSAITARFEGNVVFDGTKSSGTISKYSEGSLVKGTTKQLLAVIEGIRPYNSTTYLGPATLTSYYLGFGYENGSAVVSDYIYVKDLSLNSANVLASKFAETSLNGNDSISIFGALGSSSFAWAGDDSITSGKNNDVIDGGQGIDTVTYSGVRTQYSISQQAAGVQVTGPDGIDTLTNIEYLKFSDQTGLVSSFLQSTGTGGSSLSTTLSIASGWNLVGNSNVSPLDVTTSLNDKTKVTTVWKWSPTASRWAFYAPSMTSTEMATYAAGKGYDVLTTINGGEGFWVNSTTYFSATLPAGTAFASSSFASTLGSGWSLISIGDNKSPRAFNNSLSTTPPNAGTVAASVLTTLWAWDVAKSAWYFYAPSLDNTNGLATYATSKNYLDFGIKTLEPGTGFWVNKP